MNQKNKINLNYLIGRLKGHFGVLMLGGISMLVYVSCWPILAWLAGKLIPAIGQGNTNRVLSVIVLALFIFIIQKTAQYLQDSLLAKPALALSQDLRTTLFSKLQKTNILFIEKLSSGDIAYRLTEDVDRVGEVIYKSIQDTTPSIFQLIAVLGYMIFIDLNLALATIILAPLIALLVSDFGGRVLKAADQSQHKISSLAGLLSEAIQGLPMVKAFAVEEWLQKDFDKQVKLHKEAKYKMLRLVALQHPIVGLIEIIGILTILTIGTFRIQTGGISKEEFGSFFTALIMLIDPISHITSNYNELKQGQASLRRLNEITSNPIEFSNSITGISPNKILGKIIINNLSFSYNENNRVLNNINLNIDSGKIMALVGPSGAGKTTIFSLILKFIEPSNGNIFIDDYNLNKLDTNSFRKLIAIVPQKTFIFSGTISQAISFGRNASAKKIINAAKIANAHDFIEQLPNGYDTHIEERGANLSGGQLQRISIARALLGDPSILLLDEATSALDPEAEESVQKGLKQAMHKRTVLVIAHRLSTVQKADKIAFIDKGKICEVGSHNELIGKEGRYRDFCKKQLIETI
ncbi:ABC transporter ATP-binding protein [Prochlorococcus marinus]|uniref:Multidrug ABC transporter n=1 Tax=Prochlorococcus marinus XMU1408 TaxID=2213228 RepID=A0A318R2V2_PROMR|nr:ABC transporter ATP-binding protein [Prochlorococcus marinus]MBW3042014.1 multidrug ABC transporter [Prochlorococcus marinus str. XMU1408]PYE03135.1 multidrug ABC transporter [Prochlorococcus marinus XMU1408]